MRLACRYALLSICLKLNQMPSRSWTIFAQRTTAIEKAYLPKIVRLIKSFRQDFISDLKTSGKSTALSNLQQRVIDQKLTRLLQSIYRTAGLAGARMTYSEVQRYVRQSEQKAAGFGRNERWIADVLNFLKLHMLGFVQDITDTMRNDIIRVLDKGVENGWGVEEIVTELKKEGLIRSRARVIARTEIIRAANQGHASAAKDLPFEVDKKWNAARDHRTRHAHNFINGHIVNENGYFRVPNYKGDKPTGTFSEMLYPGDPEAPASQTVNCFLPSELTNVNPSIVKKAFRSRYKGKTITIQTGGGRKFSCTPNHPILTLRGWVKASDLTSSDNLVHSSFIEDQLGIQLNIQDKPTTFEQFYNSFARDGVVVGLIGSIVNFHGDKPTGNVDVVFSDRELCDRFKSGLAQSSSYVTFHQTNLRKRFSFGQSAFSLQGFKVFCRFISYYLMGFGNQIFSFFLRCLGHSEQHRFASATGGNSHFFKSSNQYVSGNRVFPSESFYTHTGFEVRDYLTQGQNDFFSSPHFVGDAYFVNQRRTDAESISDFIRTFTGFTKFDNIIGITEGFHDGYVYNLETTYQIYDINGFVAHNCRCRITHIPKRDANGRLVMKDRNQAQVIPMRRVSTYTDSQIAAQLKANIKIGVE
jgi:hypothetical protein